MLTAVTALAQTTVHLDVNDPRPLAAAAELLEDQFEIPINYEDISYAYRGDIADRTNEVNAKRTAEQKAAVPESRFKYLDARGGSLSVDSEVPPTVAGLSSVLQALVGAHLTNGLPGVYTANFADAAFFITPAQMKDSTGTWRLVTPVLDSLVSFPKRERTAYETLQTVVEQVSKLQPIQVNCCIAFGNLWASHVTLGAQNETARSVIAKLFLSLRPQNLEDGSKVSGVSYRLQYSPQLLRYDLVLRAIPQVRPDPPRPPAPRTLKQFPIPGRGISTERKL
jgi:hypothetical protein